MSLHEEAGLRRARRQFERDLAVAGEQAARNAPKVDPQSDLLSRERLRRECRGILEAWGVVDGSGLVQYEDFFQSVDRIVDFTLVSDDLQDLSREEKEVLCDRIWSCIAEGNDSDSTGADSGRGHPAVTVDEFLNAVVKVHHGEYIQMEDTEPKEIGKASRVFSIVLCA